MKNRLATSASILFFAAGWTTQAEPPRSTRMSEDYLKRLEALGHVPLYRAARTYANATGRLPAPSFIAAVTTYLEDIRAKLGDSPGAYLSDEGEAEALCFGILA